jgi:hypothetical protein
MRPLIILLCLLSLPLFADEAPPPSKLPADAAKLIAKADADIVAIRKALAAALQKSQEAATKKGDLDGALAVKGKIAEITGQIPAAAKPPAEPPVLAGVYEYTFPTGHRGKLTADAHKRDAFENGNHGDLQAEKDGWVITWGNQTQWEISIEGGMLWVSASDGRSLLSPVK